MKRTFNKEQEFEGIRKKLEEIKRECSIRGIPFFWCAAIKDMPGSTEYAMDGLTPGALGIGLNADKIPGLIMHTRLKGLS